MRPRVGAFVPGPLEPSAASRHSEPGLNGARGFPRGPGADARARWRCLVSARREVGLPAPQGRSPAPPYPTMAFRRAPCCGGPVERGVPAPNAGPPDRASERFPRALGSSFWSNPGKAHRSLPPGGAWGWGHRAWGCVGAAGGGD